MGALFGTTIGVGIGAGKVITDDDVARSFGADIVCALQTVARNAMVGAVVGGVVGFTLPVSVPLLVATPRHAIQWLESRARAHTAEHHRQKGDEC